MKVRILVSKYNGFLIAEMFHLLICDFDYDYDHDLGRGYKLDADKIALKLQEVQLEAA